MMMNLFNNLDPIILNKNMNFIFIINIIFINKFFFWKNNSNMKKKIINFIFLNIKNNNLMMNKMKMIYFFSLFNFIFLMNLLNIIPNNFSLSNNLIFSLSINLWFNISFQLFKMFKNKFFFMNFTPIFSPIFILPFINLIELNSLFIQILTLSLRLMINMMLSHLIMNIINNFIFIFLYFFMEIFIMIIQSYIIFILNLLNSNNMY